MQRKITPEEFRQLNVWVSTKQAGLAFDVVRETINRWLNGANSRPPGFPDREPTTGKLPRDEVGRAAWGSAYPW